MKKWHYFLILILSLSKIHAQNPEKHFQHIVDSIYLANPDAIGFTLHVEAPDQHISWNYAVGYSNKDTKQKLLPSQPVLIASNTKPYVSATILRLVEQDKITLDQPIEKLVSIKTATALSNAGYQLKLITIRQLLSHKSGIRDYVDDDYFAFINSNKTYQWTRDEQIERAAKSGKPYASPGNSFRYADINYLLLTEVIETCTKKPFYTSIRELLDFNKHSLNKTWFAKLEKTPKNTAARAHQYWNKFAMDTYKMDPSWDLYGGGGMISTEKDMAVFFQLLFTGKILHNANVLALMHQDVQPKTEINYCLGIRKISISGFTGYNHGGGLGTDVVYIPELNASIAVASLEAEKRPLALEISKMIAKELSLSKDVQN